MDEPHLTEEEFGLLVAACRLLQIGTPAPGYLKEFLARRLEDSGSESLAARVRQFSDGQMEAMWEQVRRRQERK